MYEYGEHFWDSTRLLRGLLYSFASPYLHLLLAFVHIFLAFVLVLDSGRRDGPLPFWGNKHTSLSSVVCACERSDHGRFDSVFFIALIFGDVTSLFIFSMAFMNYLFLDLVTVLLTFSINIIIVSLIFFYVVILAFKLITILLTCLILALSFTKVFFLVFFYLFTLSFRLITCLFWILYFLIISLSVFIFIIFIHMVTVCTKIRITIMPMLILLLVVLWTFLVAIIFIVLFITLLVFFTRLYLCPTIFIISSLWLLASYSSWLWLIVLGIFEQRFFNLVRTFRPRDEEMSDGEGRFLANEGKKGVGLGKL